MKEADNRSGTIEGALQRASFYFGNAGLERPRDEAEILLAYLLGWNRLKVFLERSAPLEESIALDFTALVERRACGEPMAYIMGCKEFYGLEFFVGREVLIPRPETELVVDAVLEWAREQQGNNISGVDLGTGSGNLAVALAYHLPQLQIHAIDLSPGALRVAAANAARHGVDRQIRFCRGRYLEAFSGIKPPPRFNLVVANPPYLTSAEMEALPLTIRNYEPHLALNGGADGLAAYRDILAELASFVQAPGLMALEIGAAQGGNLLSLCRRTGLFHSLALLHDYRDLPRVLLGSF